MTQRWERRESKLTAQRARMPKHGQGLANLYANAIRKRAAAARARRRANDPAEHTGDQPASVEKTA